MLILYNLNKQKEIKSRSLLLFTCNIKHYIFKKMKLAAKIEVLLS